MDSHLANRYFTNGTLWSVDQEFHDAILGVKDNDGISGHKVPIIDILDMQQTEELINFMKQLKFLLNTRF